MKRIGIYIHIPFCKQKCTYCDFVSFSDKFEFQEKYINAVINEIDNCYYSDVEVDTIYFGGGTPSSISGNLIIKVLNKIREKFVVNEFAEITIEVNPGTVNKDKLELFKFSGINRISIGLQVVQENLLKVLGRIHSYTDFENCIKMSREVGFNNINVDLMFGIPNQSIYDLEESLKKVIFQYPNHISLYSLILENDTPLEKIIKSGVYKLPSEEEERNMYHMAKKILEKNGYIHYEISNFARNGFESKHNLNCWNQNEYLGFGLSAHSYFNNKRFSNTDNFINYIENQKDNIEINEIQTDDIKKKEYMMLGFRKLKGISISEFERKFGINPLFYFRFEISELVEKELIEVDLDNIKLTNKGLDFANIVFQEFV